MTNSPDLPAATADDTATADAELQAARYWMPPPPPAASVAADLAESSSTVEPAEVAPAPVTTSLIGDGPDPVAATETDESNSVVEDSDETVEETSSQVPVPATTRVGPPPKANVDILPAHSRLSFSFSPKPGVALAAVVAGGAAGAALVLRFVV